MNYTDKAISMFPDAYAKEKTCNLYKLLNCFMPEFDFYKQTCEQFRRSLDIDYAYGGTLDRLGRNVNQVRGTSGDVLLRTLIKAKIAADMSEGTIDTVLDIVAFILGDSVNKAHIDELYDNTGDDREDAAFQIIAPAENIIDAGITLGQFVQLVQNIKAAGVRVTADLQGTFEFGEISEYGPEYDTGFADEAQTIGGTLGTLYDPQEDDPLPI